MQWGDFLPPVPDCTGGLFVALAKCLPVQTADSAEGQQQLIPGVFAVLECPRPDLPEQLSIQPPVVVQVIAGR
jgi:hypothetical protein